MDPQTEGFEFPSASGYVAVSESFFVAHELSIPLVPWAIRRAVTQLPFESDCEEHAPEMGPDVAALYAVSVDPFRQVGISFPARGHTCMPKNLFENFEIVVLLQPMLFSFVEKRHWIFDCRSYSDGYRSATSTPKVAVVPQLTACRPLWCSGLLGGPIQGSTQ